MECIRFIVSEDVWVCVKRQLFEHNFHDKRYYNKENVSADLFNTCSFTDKLMEMTSDTAAKYYGLNYNAQVSCKSNIDIANPNLNDVKVSN